MTDTGKPKYPLDTIGLAVLVDFSQDGKSLVFSNYNGFKVIAVEDGRLVRDVVTGKQFFDSIRLSPDGRSFVTLDRQNGSLHSLDALTGKELKSVRIAGVTAIERALFSPDAGRAFVWDRQLQSHIVDCATGQKLFDLAPISTQDVQFSADGKLLALLLGNRMIVKDAATGRELHSFPVKAEQRHCIGVFDFRSWQMAFSPNSRLIALGDGYPGRSLYNLMDSDRPPTCVYVYEVETGRLVQTLTGMNGAVNALSFSPEGGILAVGDADDRGDAAGENAAVLLWETKGWKSLGATAVRPQSAIAQIRFSPDGKTLATLAEGSTSIEFWRIPHP